MKLQHELTEMLVDRAMSGGDIVAWWNERARCCRCSRYDMEWKRCGSAKMVGGAYIEEPSAFGCIHFSD